MDATSQLKAVEVLGVLTAGGLFVWWQFRDLAREKKKSQMQKQEQQQQQQQQLQQLQQPAPAAGEAKSPKQAIEATDTAAQDPRA